MGRHYIHVAINLTGIAVRHTGMHHSNMTHMQKRNETGVQLAKKGSWGVYFVISEPLVAAKSPHTPKPWAGSNKFPVQENALNVPFPHRISGLKHSPISWIVSQNIDPLMWVPYTVCVNVCTSNNITRHVLFYCSAPMVSEWRNLLPIGSVASAYELPRTFSKGVSRGVQRGHLPPSFLQNIS